MRTFERTDYGWSCYWIGDQQHLLQELDILIHDSKIKEKMMKLINVILLTLLIACSSDGVRNGRVRNQLLPSGKKLDVIAIHLGIVDDKRDGDVIGIDYVISRESINSNNQDNEAREAFDLIRPMCEQWGIG